MLKPKTYDQLRSISQHPRVLTDRRKHIRAVRAFHNVASRNLHGRNGSLKKRHIEAAMRLGRRNSNA